jgi:hypothetical protein
MTSDEQIRVARRPSGVMRHDLTAVFNNQGDAQHVLDELLVAGYAHSGATLVSPPAPGAAGLALDTGLGGTVKQVLARLFGPPHHEPERRTKRRSCPDATSSP